MWFLELDLSGLATSREFGLKNLSQRRQGLQYTIQTAICATRVHAVDSLFSRNHLGLVKSVRFAFGRTMFRSSALFGWLG